MFTGLITDVGSVSAFVLGEDGATVRVRTRLAGELSDGDSVAVSGVCLTAREVQDSSFAAEVMGETLSRSTLGELRPGATVNLELPLRATDRLGGHVVQGHVDGTGTVREIRRDGFSRVLSIDAEPRLLRYLVEKGSVALDGVSLTVSALREHGFLVSLIPETLRRTQLGAVDEGAHVNIEVDILAKHLERLMQAGKPRPLRAAAGA
jgi:riboflavin synthase